MRAPASMRQDKLCLSANWSWRLPRPRPRIAHFETRYGVPFADFQARISTNIGIPCRHIRTTMIGSFGRASWLRRSLCLPSCNESEWADAGATRFPSGPGCRDTPLRNNVCAWLGRGVKGSSRELVDGSYLHLNEVWIEGELRKYAYYQVTPGDQVTPRGGIMPHITRRWRLLSAPSSPLC